MIAHGWRMTCDDCREDFLLIADVGRWLCAQCWRRAGCPSRRSASMEEIHLAEVAARERMNARGGADRHMVRSGKS